MRPSFPSTLRRPWVILCAVALGALAAPPARSNDAQLPIKPWITEADLRALMIGRPMAGVYPGGTPWRETIHADGTTDYIENGQKKPGRWWFDKEGFLCFNYPATGTGGCFKYVRLTANCYEHFAKPRQDEAAEPMAPGSLLGLPSNGRLWSDEKPSTCEAEPTV